MLGIIWRLNLKEKHKNLNCKMRVLLLTFFLVSCFSGPINSQPREVRNPCFTEKPSLNDLNYFQSEDNCELFDYKYIFPLINQSCEYWENFENIDFVHFTKIFIESEERFVCFRQEYLDSPVYSF